MKVAPEDIDAFMEANPLPEEVPPCRACGKVEWVAAYWPEAPEKTICITCCETAEHDDGETGHVWKHDPPERDWCCTHCGQYRRNTNDWPDFD